MDEQVSAFEKYLTTEEKSMATIEKYLRDVRAFLVYLDGRPISKEEPLRIKNSWRSNTLRPVPTPCWLL